MRAYIGLGANLGNRAKNLETAIDRLGRPPFRLLRVSTVRETDPVGITEQPRFLNAVAAIETELGPRAVLDRLLEIEHDLGRDRSREARWGPRAIDLDLLLYGGETIDEPGLTVPHPRLSERRFVLEPLAEIAPDLSLPDGRAVRDLLVPELE